MAVHHPGTLAIVRDSNRCGGDPTLAGTRIAVHDVVSYVSLYHGDLKRVHDEALPDLSVAQLHAVVDWYGEHQEEIDAILSDRRQDYEQGVARANATK
jgi:uncharacterized protein (DUF433 family)